MRILITCRRDPEKPPGAPGCVPAAINGEGSGPCLAEIKHSGGGLEIVYGDEITSFSNYDDRCMV